MNVIRLIAILTLLLATHLAHATRQGGDPILWKGVTHYPERGPTIWAAFPEKQKPKFEIESTGNWKGYRGEWEIKDGVLFLTSLDGKIAGKKVQISDLFPGQKSPIPATWWSGIVIIPARKEIGLLKKGEARYVYTKETHLTIEKGKLVKTEMKTFDPKKTPVWKI